MARLCRLFGPDQVRRAAEQFNGRAMDEEVISPEGKRSFPLFRISRAKLERERRQEVLAEVKRRYRARHPAKKTGAC